MRPIHILTLAVALAANTAMADQGPTQDQLSILITGNTLYVTIPAGAPGAPEGGVAQIYFGRDGAARAALPAGQTLIGTWSLGEIGYCIDWENGPRNSCSVLTRAGDSFVVTDAASGDPRGRVFTISMGNPENL